MKEMIREILLEFNRSELTPYIHREVDIPKLPPSIRKALVFIGMRRVGKTYLMYQDMVGKLENGLVKSKLLYINFEDDRLAGFKAEDFQTVLDVYFELYPDFAQADDLNFYFDEIQNISGWEKFIRRLIDKEKMSLFITGSSAKLLSREIATSLRGRCLDTEVFPLSFKEYLKYKGVTDTQLLTSKDKSVIKHHCQTYLQRGGFPETLDMPDNLHHQTIQTYVNSAVFRDVIDRHQLKKPHLVKLFLINCLQNISSLLSVTKIYNSFKSKGEELSRGSLYEYLQYFEDAYLICTVPIFNLSTRTRQVNPSKIYCVDSGIIAGYSIKLGMEFASSLENAVYIQLRKMHFENIFYYKTNSGKEVDFAAQHANGAVELFQVTVDLNDEKTKEREISALLHAAKELGIKEAKIITFDTSEILEIDSITLHILPYWQWVLS
jgi:uncharacterized protein